LELSPSSHLFLRQNPDGLAIWCRLTANPAIKREIHVDR